MKLSLLLISALIFVSIVNATVITVDNNYPKIGQFATLQEAHDAASSDDTLYVMPSIVSYSSITLTKKLIICGVGFEPQSIGMQATVIIDTMEFNTGSEGSILQGFGNRFFIIINCNNIIIKRNFLRKVIISSGSLGIVITQNKFAIQDRETSDAQIYMNDSTEVLISNNYFYNFAVNNVGTIFAGNKNTSIYLYNNIFDRCTSTLINVSDANHFIANNIFDGGNCIGVNLNGCYNNLCTKNQIPMGNGNLVNISTSVVYLGLDDCHLKENSPAIGSGLNGVDMGMYGGPTPFIDKGIPDLPSIYYLDVPLTGTQKEGINVTIKVKSNN